ncbi:MAG: helix-turn-helix domain-containing protein [Myxococcales bacterium]|nr:helix-turn-helix domain-containing protein [Myxococcales bacterium]
MKLIRRFLPTLRRVVLLVPPEAQLIGAMGALEVLDAANRVLVHAGRQPAYELVLAGVEGATRSIAGAVLQPADIDVIEAADVLVVGGASVEGAVDPRVAAAVARLAPTAERVVGVCVGAFALGETGWLDGRRCTTHWLSLDELARRFPAALVETDALYVEDGPVLTSAGGAAGIDLALHLVRSDLGPRVARAVARALVVFAHRPGGQSQFDSALRLRPHLDGTLRAVVDEVLAHPGRDHRVEVLAERAHMSPRHFARVFRDQAGETPAAFVTRARVEAAQRALAQSDDGLDAIGAACGFGTTDGFRRAFQRVTGVTPSAWRERFG